MKKEYSWGDFGYKQDAQEVGDYLNKIQKKNGGLTASQLLEYAKDPESPIHDMFDWDDKSAAIKYREEQARKIIRSLRVTLTGVSVSNPEIEFNLKKDKAFPNIRKIGEQEGVYKPIENVIESKEDFKTYKNKAYQELTSCVNKYKRIQQLSKIMGELQLTIDKLFSE